MTGHGGVRRYSSRSGGGKELLKQLTDATVDLIPDRANLLTDWPLGVGQVPVEIALARGNAPRSRWRQSVEHRASWDTGGVRNGWTPMLARLSPTLPQGPEWVYEPRWDGFRGLLVRRGESVRILSRNGRLLEPYFPELFSSALRPPREVLDRWENPRSQERQAGVLGPA
jgi:hypothetical protein